MLSKNVLEPLLYWLWMIVKQFSKRPILNGLEQCSCLERNLVPDSVLSRWNSDNMLLFR